MNHGKRDRIVASLGICALGEVACVACTTDGHLLGELPSRQPITHEDASSPEVGSTSSGGSAGRNAGGAPGAGNSTGGSSSDGDATDGGSPDAGATTCRVGTFRSAAGAPCTKWQDCAAGQYVTLQGTADRNRECAPCDAGTFSTATNSASCNPWRVCPVAESEPGTSTSDRTCSVDEWTRQFGASQEDAVGSVAVDGDGNVYVVGSVTNALPAQTSAGDSDAYIRKYDATGTEIWTRQFGSAGPDSAGSVAVDGRNVYVAGFVGAALPGQTFLGAWDSFVRKYDDSGSEQWTRQFGSPGYDFASVSLDGQGNLFVSGFSEGDLPQTPVETDGGARGTFFSSRYDGSGNASQSVELRFDSGQESSGSSRVDASGNVYFFGTTDSTLAGQTNAGAQDAFVIKYDGSGHLQWQREFGTTLTDNADAISFDQTGSVYLAGHTFQALPGQVSASPGVSDAFVRKYDAAGTEVWTRQFGTTGVDAATAIQVDGAGVVYVAGTTTRALPGQTSAGSTDAFVRKYDGDGNVLATRQFGTSDIDTGVSLALDGSGEPYIAGRTNGEFPGATNPDVGVFFDAFLAKLAP